MLTTLFKHEIKATARTFLWLYIAFIIIAAVNVLISPQITGMAGPYHTSESAPAMGAALMIPSIIQSIVMVLYFLSIAAISIGTLVIVILRFYRNLLGDEGYLMFTLPVGREQHILSKLLVAVIWVICSTVLVFISIMLLLGNLGVLPEITQGLKEITAMGIPVNRWIISGIIALLISCFTSVLMLYAAMAIGPNLLKNRVGGSILAYIIIYVVSQIVMAFVTFTSVKNFIKLNQDSVIVTNETITMTESAGHEAIVSPGLSMTQQDISSIDAVIWICIAAYAVIGVCCWFLTRFMLKKKLNLA